MAPVVAIIGGCGHVGLPLGLSLADRNCSVSLVDIDERVVAMVNAGQMPFRERGAEPILKRVAGKNLHATTDRTGIRTADVVVIIVGTPVDEHLNPDTTLFDRIVAEYAAHCRRGQLVILRSTVYPGTTRRLGAQLDAMKVEADVAYCPERVAEGFALEETARLPQIIGGLTPRATQRAREFFALIAEKVIEVDPMEAELAKLFTNTWRYLNFAVSNQFYMLAESFGLDFYRIYDAMVRDYPRMAGFARPGFAAGPCLFKDTMQLAAFSQNNFFLGHAAMLVNEGLPAFVVDRLRREVSLADKTVGVLGMAFKANSDDPRESLAYKLRKLLLWEAKEVLCSDVYIKDPSFVPAEELVRRSDVVILSAPHAEYRSLDVRQKRVVDLWGFWPRG